MPAPSRRVTLCVWELSPSRWLAHAVSMLSQMHRCVACWLQVALHRVPGHAAWFIHDAVHDVERQQLPEFIDGRAPSKTPQVTTRRLGLCSFLQSMWKALYFTLGRSQSVQHLQIYKQYRNAIIEKYREDVKRRLTYVDARAAVEVRL